MNDERERSRGCRTGGDSRSDRDPRAARRRVSRAHRPARARGMVGVGGHVPDVGLARRSAPGRTVERRGAQAERGAADDGARRVPRRGSAARARVHVGAELGGLPADAGAHRARGDGRGDAHDGDPQRLRRARRGLPHARRGVEARPRVARRPRLGRGGGVVRAALVVVVWLLVVTTTARADADKDLRKEVVVAAPVADVWAAWTTNAGARTFFARGSNIELKRGGAYEILFFPDAPPGSRGAEGLHVLAFVPTD